MNHHPPSSQIRFSSNHRTNDWLPSLPLWRVKVHNTLTPYPSFLFLGWKHKPSFLHIIHVLCTVYSLLTLEEASNSIITNQTLYPTSLDSHQRRCPRRLLHISSRTPCPQCCPLLRTSWHHHSRRGRFRGAIQSSNICRPQQLLQWNRKGERRAMGSEPLRRTFNILGPSSYTIWCWRGEKKVYSDTQRWWYFFSFQRLRRPEARSEHKLGSAVRGAGGGWREGRWGLVTMGNV